MASFDRNPSRVDGESASPWLVAAAVAATGVLAGIAYLLTRPRKRLSVSTRAHAADGVLLPTRCSCSEDAVCEVSVRNTVLREVTSQAQVENDDGTAVSNEVSTTVPVLAREVCLHVRVQDGGFASAPEYEDGSTAAHVRSERELIVFLGDMQPSAEARVRVRVCACS